MKIKALSFLKNYQTRRFLLFFFAATFVWFINNLNETYQKNILFPLKFENSNQDLFVGPENPTTVSLYVSGSGFRLLSLHLNRPQLTLGLNAVAHRENQEYYLPENKQLAQFANQLSGQVKVLGFTLETPIKLSLFKLTEKKVKLHLNSSISVAPNKYIYKTTLSKDSVVVRGLKKFVDQVQEAQTTPLLVNALDRSLDTLIGVDWSGAQAMQFVTPRQVRVGVEVVEFSEIEIEATIVVKGLPPYEKVNFFPNTLMVVLAAPLPVLKRVSQEDFELSINYQELLDANTPLVFPRVKSLNEALFKVYLKDYNGVEFILTKIK